MVIDRVRVTQPLHGEKQHQKQGPSHHFRTTVAHARSVIKADGGVHRIRGLSDAGPELFDDGVERDGGSRPNALIGHLAERGFLGIDLDQGGAMFQCDVRQPVGWVDE